MPAIPAITGGAGKGSLNNENIKPTNAPVPRDSSISAIVVFLVVSYFCLLAVVVFHYQIRMPLIMHSPVIV